ncbi:hypothetical protein GTW78_06675 [Streptomyces sp. SID4948]|nr:hypothetical protein [Streptomyces sp. SID4948]MYS19932.1 hypothetical protein [Streptomyces sp. SID4948]
MVGTALLSGCGIRSTSVPVDAGPAPSRVACAPPKAPSAPSAGTVLQQVYLVCSTQIAAVTRAVALPDGRAGRDTFAQELIAQLQIGPAAEETKAGFSTEVPGSLYLLPPPPGSPKGALRLNEPVDELPSFALAQIVCTLTADKTTAPDHSVVLGSAGSGALRRYTCTDDLRTRPEAADTAGSVVR